jgi:hypothetical protein
MGKADPASQELTVVTGSSLVPVRRIITVSDAEGYSNRPNDDQRDLQNRMADVQHRAALNAGLDLDQAIVQPRGDGNLTAWPPGTSELDLITNYLRELRSELDRLNGTLSKGNRIRMRLAVTTGLVELAAQGIPGQAAIKAALLADSDQLRAALRTARRHSLAVILDDGLFEDVVRTRLRGLRPEAYKRVTIRDKYGKDCTAWITVLGAGQPGVSASSSGSPEGDADPPRGDQPGPDSSQPGSDRKRRRRRLPVPITVAMIGAVAAITAAAIDTAASSSPGSPSAPPSARASVVATASKDSPTARPSTGTSASPGTARTVTEYADWANGVNVYANNQAATSNVRVIPFNQQVEVSCVAPNDSGIESINAFYLIVSGPWTGTYASANEFTNGGARESAADPAIDPRVRSCAAS